MKKIVVSFPDKKRFQFKYLLWAFVLINSFAFKIAGGQAGDEKKVFITSKNYNQLKIENKLDPAKTYVIDLKKEAAPFYPKINANRPNLYYKTTATGICDTLLGCDSSHTLVPGIDVPNDDFPGNEIILPFVICLYGTNYTSVYVNNNGNFTFGAGYGVFTPVGFPNNTAIMIAPFWADVDTRVPSSGPVSNLPCMELSNTHITVIWDYVDYYSTQDPTHVFLFNTFRCTVTDGLDPILPPGTNVGFFYGDMSWTTGDASMGTNGFGGAAATVGANAGNGIDYIQFGRFDQPGTAYDGSFGNNDGVDFLDNRTFVFSTCDTSASFNIPPIFSGNYICDTLEICIGDTANLNYNFLPGEATQIATPAFNNNGIANFTVDSLVAGANGILNLVFIPDVTNVGLNTITVSATDNGAIPATSTFNIVIRVNNLPVPVITGPHYYCVAGSGVTLTAPPGYATYSWNTGVTNVDTLHVMTGTYNVEVTDANGCRGKSPAFPVWESDPNPIIGGITAVCEQGFAYLTTTHPFQAYDWIDSATSTTISVNDTLSIGTGTYAVTVTDTMGCTATSPPLTVAIHQNPNALFSYSPTSVLAGDTIHFTDLSTATSGHIVSWFWDFGDGATSNLQHPSHAFATADSHAVSLTVTQSDGCSKTYSFTIEPTEIIVYNIITPNSDGRNDVFVFEHLEFYPNSKLEIYNRWGRKVYENSNYQNDWKGGDLSAGVYYYIMKVPEKDVMKGTLTIMK